MEPEQLEERQVKPKPRSFWMNLLYGLGLLGVGIILTLMAMPNFTSDGDGYHNCKICSVKANMHTLQTIVDTYAVDWGGVYPQDVTSLKAEAVVKGREFYSEQ